MCAAPVSHDELTRRRALRALDILDSPPEAVFDALAQTAALICEAPIALIQSNRRSAPMVQGQCRVARSH